MQIGTYNQLTIDRKTQVGLFLTDGKEDVLLPVKYIPKTYEIGEELTVFVYLDHEERPVATTLKPYAILGDFAFLRVNHVNRFGAFLDWGLEKDLFVPFREQARPMEEGKRYLVHIYMDQQTNRLVASSKLRQFLDKEPASFEPGEEVELIISHQTNLGVNVIINRSYSGLVYKSELFEEALRPGDHRKGYIKEVRQDGKIDVSFNKTGIEAIEDNAERVLNELRSRRGFLRLTDHSSPEDIKTILKMSKKNFKKAVGTLYKQHLVDIKEDGIYLKEYKVQS